MFSCDILQEDNEWFAKDCDRRAAEELLLRVNKVKHTAFVWQFCVVTRGIPWAFILVGGEALFHFTAK